MRKEDMALPLILTLGTSLRLINLLSFHSLESDQAVYSQAIFALTKGYVPYREMYLAHPPLYFYMAYPFVLLMPHLYSLRLFNVILSMGTLYVIFRFCELSYSRRVAVVASLIYAIYPFAIYTSKLVLVDNALSLFTTVSIFFLARYLSKRDLKDLALSGFFSGVSCMTKYTGIPVLIAVFIFILIRVRRLKPLVLFVTGFLIFPLGVLVWLISLGAWHVFYTQTIHWQLIRFGLYPAEKSWFLIHGLGVLSLLIMFALPKMLTSVGCANDELMGLWFSVPLIGIFTSKLVFLQYFIILLMPLCILTARTIDQYQLYVHTRSDLRRSWRKVMMVIVVVTVMEYAFWGYMTSNYGYDWSLIKSCFVNEDQRKLLERQMAAGNYIKSTTSPEDKIWTTDAAVAFFAQRVIVTTDSGYWKYQGFFPDVWGYGWTKDDYRGPIKEYPNGTISLSEIKLALEEEKPNIIVMVNESVADYFIWNGINNPYHSEEGLADFIKNHYHLTTDQEGSALASQGIEIWIRHTSIE